MCAAKRSARDSGDGNRLVVPFAIEQVGHVLEAGRITAVVFGRNDDDAIGVVDSVGKPEDLFGGRCLERKPFVEQWKPILFQIENLNFGESVFKDIVLEIERYAVTLSPFADTS